jgi:hypothetical protein
VLAETDRESLLAVLIVVGLVFSGKVSPAVAANRDDCARAPENFSNY